MDTFPPPALTSSDVVIAVMGITGSGKSTFISHLVDGDVGIGHDLTSCTTDIGVYSFVYRHTQRVYLIDTPGFDDSGRSDTDILKDIAFFLSQTYMQTVRLTGIIYLHRITDVRMAGSSLRNLAIFKKLCGDDAYKHVVLATTMWSNLNGPDLSFNVGIQRESELIAKKDWWGLMHQRGSQVIRHSGDRESALAIIGYLVGLRSKVVLDIQKEMVDLHKDLEDTAAGKEVEKELQETKRIHQEHIKELLSAYEQALQDRDEHLAKALVEQREELEQKLAQANQAQDGLKTSLERLAEEKTKEYKQLLAQVQAGQERSARVLAMREQDYKQFEEERERSNQTHRESQEQYERNRAGLEQRLRDMIEQERVAEAQRQQEEMRRFDLLQAEAEARFEREQARNNEREIQLAAQVQQAQEEQESRSRNSSSISLLAGLGTTGLGVVTLNPALLAAGLMVTGPAAAAFGNRS